MSKSDNNRTFILLKPDAIERGLVRPIINRFLNNQYYIIQLDCTICSVEKLNKMYLQNISVNDSQYYSSLKDYFQDKIVIPIILGYTGKKDPIGTARKMIGDYNPQKASLGTIRYDYRENVDIVNTNSDCFHNLIHAASTMEEYHLDARIWFPEKEMS